MKTLTTIILSSLVALGASCKSTNDDEGAAHDPATQGLNAAKPIAATPTANTVCPEEEPDKEYRFAVGASPGYRVSGLGHNAYKCSARFVDSDVVKSSGQHQTLIKAGPFQSYDCENEHPSMDFMAVEANELKIEALDASNIDVPVGPIKTYELSADGKQRFSALPYDTCGFPLSGDDITVVWEPEQDCGFTIKWETDPYGNFSIEGVRSGDWTCEVKVSTFLADKEVEGRFKITVK